MFHCLTDVGSDVNVKRWGRVGGGGWEVGRDKMLPREFREGAADGLASSVMERAAMVIRCRIANVSAQASCTSRSKLLVRMGSEVRRAQQAI